MCRRVVLFALLSSVGGCGPTALDGDWPPTGEWRLTSEHVVADLALAGPIERCSAVAGPLGDREECSMYASYTGRVREMPQGTEYMVSGTAMVSDAGFEVEIAPQTEAGAPATSVGGCSYVVYASYTARTSEGADGVIRTTCYGAPEGWKWDRTESARLRRR